jgi:hypothetical protein
MKIIKAEFSGSIIQFQSDGWFNATEAAKKFGKETSAWLRQKESVEYIAALAEELGKGAFLEDLSEINKLDGSTAVAQTKLLKLAKSTGLVKVRLGSPVNGGGTWMHPNLAVVFARWLDVRFSIWCDVQIKNLINQETDWRKQRHLAASTHKLMAEMLKDVRDELGKETKAHHYSNESRLINWALTGEFCSLERDQLSAHQLDVLAALESRNTLLIGRGVEYAKRKIILEQLAIDMRKPELKLVGGAL